MHGYQQPSGVCRDTATRALISMRAQGLEGLTDRSRRPYRQANRLPFQVETLILSLKREHPSWGAPKIRAKLRRRFPDIKPPAINTVHAVLDRNGLVSRGRERHHYAQGTTLSSPTPPTSATAIRSPSLPSRAAT